MAKTGTAAQAKAATATATGPAHHIKPAARIFNFGAGPATMPVEVLEKAKWELVNWQDAGMSVMEMSHRGKEFVAIAAEAEADLRKLLGVPANYKVLFLQGGATLQFSGVPMNLLRGGKRADYLHTGEWSKKAIAEAKRFCEVNVVASSEDRNFTYVPKQSAWKRSAGAAYLHVCTNETIGGVEFQWTPELGETPLVADMSSHILSRPVDVSKFGLIYAGAQKNIGPAGLVVVIVREDLIGRALPGTPNVLDYKLMAEADSMLNTPPTFSVQVAARARWARRDREGQRPQGGAALPLPRFPGLLLQPRGEGRPLAHERAVPPARRQARREIPRGSRGARALAVEGPSLGGRHEGLDLQRDAGGGRRGARGVHGRLPRASRP
jgi:phosphoserine aminotransferase